MSKRAMLVAACVSFFGLGWLAAGLGPALEGLAEQTNSDLASIGGLAALSLLGGLVTQIASGPINDRYGQRVVVLAGVTLIIPGVIGVILSHNLWLTLSLGVIWGLGFGALEIGHNVLIAGVYNDRANTMNLLHAFFGVGAIMGPAFAGLAIKWWDTALPALWIGAGLLALTLPLVYRLPRGLITSSTAQADAIAASGAFSYRTALLWLLGGVMLVYVGIEIGISNWTPAYLERSTSLDAGDAAFATSAFWFALTAGRVIMAAVGERFAPARILWMSMIGAAVDGVLLAVSTGSIAITVLAVLISGFFYGPIYPTMMVILTGAFRNGPGKAASVGAAMGGLGGGLLQWGQGALLDKVSPSASVIFVGAGALIMLVVWSLAAQRLTQHQSAPELEPVPARH